MKTVVLTGGTSGIGLAIAKKILKASGSEIETFFINYGHDDLAAETMLEQLPKEQRKRIQFIKADLTTYEGMELFSSKVLSQTSTIDWFISNVGIGSYELFEDYSPQLWEKVMRTNVTIPVFLVQAFKNHINPKGKIVFIGSLVGEIPCSSSMVYGVSKAALHFAAKSLLKEFEGKNISINAIAPGFVETAWHKNRSQESYDRINSKIALHRFGAPEEVANLCFHILENDYINGSVLEINGGYNYY